MKKLMTLAAIGILAAGLGTVNAAETTKAASTTAGTLKNGLANGLKNGTGNGLKNGTKSGLKNGLKSGLRYGLKNGKVNGNRK